MLEVAEGTLAVYGQVSLLLQLVVHVPNDLIGFGAADTEVAMQLDGLATND